MRHILNLTEQEDALNSIFVKIRESNTILFLGAGASVGEKRYLSKELINYYEAKIEKNINEPNITKWIDMLSADESFNRADFDHFVNDILQKLKVLDAHRILAGIPWREIITTNYDILIEKAFDEVKDSHKKLYDLKTIRSQQQYNYKEAKNEIKYVKLNGCISDKSLYPLAFSTDDFKRIGSFYKVVLNDLKNISHNIQFLSIGYSFQDDFGKDLLEKFDSYNYRDKRWIVNVDPYPNESALPYFTKNKICIVKCSFQDFFQKYKEWETRNAESIVRKKGLTLSNSKNFQITTPPQLLLRLEGAVKQLNHQTRERHIKDEEFYKGEEPNFQVITRGLDVIKTKFIQSFSQEIKNIIEAKIENFAPIFFLCGDFGIGKSTFTLRLIYELEKTSELDLVAFEIIDLNGIRKEDLIDLIKTVKSKNIVFLCDEVEVESYFKTLLRIQLDISIEQFQDCNIFFIAPIRQNILEKFKLNRYINNSYELNLSGEFSYEEIDELLDKLKDANLVDFRDEREKKTLINQIIREYNADSFIALMATITSGRHEQDLVNSYHQLSKEAQKAFLFTALIHKHKLLMPASWLKQNIKMNWDDFVEKIVKAEGKGILIQENKPSHGAQPDLYFRTKHPLIAERLIEKFIPNIDQQFKQYEQMLKKIEFGSTNSYLVNNLLKALRRSGIFNHLQINKLYDAAHTKLSEDPYFLLNYAINLQNRKTKQSITSAISHITYAESLLEFRNHKFIHRRAVLNFELAKSWFSEDENSSHTLFYLKEAEELFALKQILDPFSSFSYVDYIRLAIWQLENLNYEVEDHLQTQILIQDLFDLANRTVTDNINRVHNLRIEYASYLEKITNSEDYEQYLEGLYHHNELRPYACILLYNNYLNKERVEKCEYYLSEMETMQHNTQVVKLLLKIYGRSLFCANKRIKLLQLIRENPLLEKEEPLRCNFFRFMAESYNYNFHHGRKYLSNIQNKYHNINPEFHYEWKDPDGKISFFEATLIKRDNDRFKTAKIANTQNKTRLVKGDYSNYPIGSKVRVKLHFYLYGLMAEIVQTNEKEELNKTYHN